MKFDKLTSAYVPVIERLLSETNGTEYRALFLEPNIAELSRDELNSVWSEIRAMYTLGILERSHIACITSLGRASRWIVAIQLAVNNGNALGFSAALRGLLESSADSHDVMKYLPAALTENMKYIYQVLHAPQSLDAGMLGFDELEQKLIHYAYARRKPRDGSAPLPNHVAKSNAEYISQLEGFDVSGAMSLYSELCELTHPASPSISCFIDEGDDLLVFNHCKDRSIIDDILTRYENCLDLLVQLTLNPALLGLAVLRRFVPYWPAPTNGELDGIPFAKRKLQELDDFVAASGQLPAEQIVSR